MVSLLLLPLTLAFSLVFGILVLPFLILRAVIKLFTALLVLPLMLAFAFVGLLVGALAFAVAVLIPLLPFAAVAVLVYALTRHSPAASAARG